MCARELTVLETIVRPQVENIQYKIVHSEV